VSTSGLPPLLWGLLCTVSGATLWVWHGDAFPALILVSSGAGAMALGLALQIARPRDVYARPRAVTDGSVATVACAVGLALMGLGLAAGLWIALVGAGVVALGVGGLVRERLAARRLLGREGEAPGP
jgi:hypothetical protein